MFRRNNEPKPRKHDHCFHWEFEIISSNESGYSHDKKEQIYVCCFIDPDSKIKCRKRRYPDY